MTGAFALVFALATGPPAAAPSFHIDPAPLTRCLEQLTLATGARFIVSEGVARSVRCQAADAASIAALLDAALAGAPVRWRLRDDGVYLVVPSGPPAEATLDPLTIETDAQARDLAAAPGPLPGPAPRAADLRSETRYTPEQLAAKPFVKFGQLGRLAPNVYGSAEGLSIRGVPRDNDYFSGVSVFYDGVDVGTLLLDNDVLAVDELDSLRYGRGASAYLHGGGSAGGAIYLDTPRPNAQLGGRVRASYGERSAHSYGASVSGPIVAGLSARVAVSHAEEPRFVENRTVTAIDGDTDTRDRAVVKVLFEPDALPGLTLSANAFRVDAETPDRFVARRQSDPPSAIFDEISFDSTARDWRLDALGVGTRGEYRFDNGIELGWHASDLDADRSAIEGESMFFLATRLDTEQRTRYGVLAALPFGGAWRVHTAIEAQRLESAQGLAVETRETEPPQRQVDTTALDVDGIGASVEVAWDAGGRWRASAGARRIEDDVHFLTTRERTGRDLERIIETRSDYSRLLPAGGVEFDVTPTQQLSARYDRGYRTGGRSEIDFVGEYAPETLETVELAWRSVWLDGRLTGNAAVFHTDWRDRSSIDGTIGVRIIEPIETRIVGGELEVQYAATEALDLGLGIGVLDNEYRRGQFAASNQLVDLRGQRGADAPEATAVGSIAWRGPYGLFATLDAYHARVAGSVAFGGLGVPPERDAYTVVDARVGWRNDDVEVVLDVGNALDEHYIDRFVERRTFSRRIGAPRQIGVSVAWSW